MYTGQKILVVEDEPLIALLIADWLQELEYEVAGTANSIAEAMRIADKIELDAALLDVNLGGDESFSLADALRAKGVAVAFITGRDTNNLPERFKEAQVLAKPFEFTAIQAFLGRLMAGVGRSQ
jgi:DNA-binding response OmpR family regulator